MQVKSIAECSKGSRILQYFQPPLSYHFVLSIFEWPFYTGFTVLTIYTQKMCLSRTALPVHFLELWLKFPYSPHGSDIPVSWHCTCWLVKISGPCQNSENNKTTFKNLWFAEVALVQLINVQGFR